MECKMDDIVGESFTSVSNGNGHEVHGSETNKQATSDQEPTVEGDICVEVCEKGEDKLQASLTNVECVSKTDNTGASDLNSNVNVSENNYIPTNTEGISDVETSLDYKLTHNETEDLGSATTAESSVISSTPQYNSAKEVYQKTGIDESLLSDSMIVNTSNDGTILIVTTADQNSGSDIIVYEGSSSYGETQVSFSDVHSTSVTDGSIQQNLNKSIESQINAGQISENIQIEEQPVDQVVETLEQHVVESIEHCTEIVEGSTETVRQPFEVYQHQEVTYKEDSSVDQSQNVTVPLDDQQVVDLQHIPVVDEQQDRQQVIESIESEPQGLVIQNTNDHVQSNEGEENINVKENLNIHSTENISGQVSGVEVLDDNKHVSDNVEESLDKITGNSHEESVKNENELNKSTEQHISDIPLNSSFNLNLSTESIPVEGKTENLSIDSVEQNISNIVNQDEHTEMQNVFIEDVVSEQVVGHVEEGKSMSIVEAISRDFDETDSDDVDKISEQESNSLPLHDIKEDSILSKIHSGDGLSQAVNIGNHELLPEHLTVDASGHVYIVQSVEDVVVLDSELQDHNEGIQVTVVEQDYDDLAVQPHGSIQNQTIKRNKDTTSNIPVHVLGRNIENPADDTPRNGKLPPKPRLGVKIPYRNLTSQIVTKDELAQELLERQKQKYGEVGQSTGDILFAKKLTQNLARKIAPVKSPKKQASSNEKFDNSDLIAILEGDDDMESKKNIEILASEASTSEANIKALSKTLEKELALKQLNEFPLNKVRGRKTLAQREAERRRFITPVKSKDTGEISVNNMQANAAEKNVKPDITLERKVTDAKVADTKNKNVLVSKGIQQLADSPEKTSTVSKLETKTVESVKSDVKIVDGKEKFVAKQSKEVETKQTETKSKSLESKIKVTDLKVKLTDVKPKVPEQKGKQNDSKTKLIEVKPSVSDIKTKLSSELKSKVNETKGKITETKHKIAEIKSKIPETKSKIPETKSKITETKPKITETKMKITETKPKLNETKVTSSQINSDAKTPVNSKNDVKVEKLLKKPLSNTKLVEVNKNDKAELNKLEGNKVVKSANVPETVADSKEEFPIERKISPTGPIKTYARKRRLSEELPEVPSIPEKKPTIASTPKEPTQVYVTKSSRIIKRKVIWDPDEPSTARSLALKSPKLSETSPKVEKPAKTEKKLTAHKTPVKSEVQKSSPKYPDSMKVKPRLTEVDRLLMDEGAVNMLYAINNTDEAPKKKRSVISLDKVEKDLLNKKNEIKKELRSTSDKLSPKSLRKKDSPVVPSPKKAATAPSVMRKKSKDSSRSSVHSPPASPGVIYLHQAEASRIIRRHSSSSFSSTEGELQQTDPLDITDTTVEPEKVTKRKAGHTANEGSKSKKLKPSIEKEQITITTDKSKITQETLKNFNKLVEVEVKIVDKYNKYKTFCIKRIDHLVQIILLPTTNNQAYLTTERLRELTAILKELQNDNNCNVVVISSSAVSFCQGINYRYLVNEKEQIRKAIAKKFAVCVSNFLKALATFPKILVAGVHGDTLGLGVTMLPLFDMVIASDTATFNIQNARLGCAVEGGSLLSLPHLMHNVLVSELLYASRKLIAAEALRLGMVTRILWPDKFQQELVSVVKLISNHSLQFMQMTKKQLRHHMLLNIDAALTQEVDTLVQHWTSPECQKNFVVHG